jgi:hypothetical protein
MNLFWQQGARKMRTLKRTRERQHRLSQYVYYRVHRRIKERQNWTQRAESEADLINFKLVYHQASQVDSQQRPKLVSLMLFQ